MDVLAAYREVGSYRGAAAICGTTYKTVRRIVEQHEASSRADSACGPRPARIERSHNYDDVVDVVARMVDQDPWSDLSKAAASGSAHHGL